MNRHLRIATISCILLLLLAVLVGGPSISAQGQDPPPVNQGLPDAQPQDLSAIPDDTTSVLPQAAVPGAFWTAVGSTGTVDEASQSLILHELGYVRMKPGVIGRAIIRYNVVAVDGLLPGGNTRRITLLTHFLDNGPGAQVVTRLCRVPHVGAPAAACFLTIGSNPDVVPVSWRTKLATSACQAVDFNFGRYAYVVEVQLIQTTTAGVAALSTLRSHATAC
ncbi:MAG: hypothetical protein ACJ8CR_10500 [Roseiflexaceae bacterium]